MQAYYAVKANSDPAIVETLYEAGASFDVASMAEFHMVHENIKSLPAKERQDFIWDKIIYANPIKDIETLVELDPYKPLVTYDNRAEIAKLKKYAPHAGLILRMRVPNTGAVVELSSKFGASSGEAVDLIEAAFEAGLTVEGLSFHVGSQMHELYELRAGAESHGGDFRGGPRARLSAGKNSRHRRRLSRALRSSTSNRSANWPRLSTPNSTACSRKEMEILAEPGRFLVATAATSVAGVIGKAVRDGKQCYYINDGVYHTYLGRDLRSHPLSGPSLQRRPDASLLGLRPDVRRARYDFAGRATARSGTRRSRLQREHRRVHARLVDALQRLSAGEGGACEQGRGARG